MIIESRRSTLRSKRHESSLAGPLGHAHRRKTALSLAVAVLALPTAFNLSAATLAGVTLPDTAQVGGTALTLNGLGLRTKFTVKVYIVGLYLEQKSSDPSAIIKADAPKRIVMHFVHSATKN